MLGVLPEHLPLCPEEVLGCWIPNVTVETAVLDSGEHALNQLGFLLPGLPFHQGTRLLPFLDPEPIQDSQVLERRQPSECVQQRSSDPSLLDNVPQLGNRLNLCQHRDQRKSGKRLFILLPRSQSVDRGDPRRDKK